VAYHEARMEEADDDPAFIAVALGNIARAYGTRPLTPTIIGLRIRRFERPAREAPPGSEASAPSDLWSGARDAAAPFRDIAFHEQLVKAGFASLTSSRRRSIPLSYGRLVNARMDELWWSRGSRTHVVPELENHDARTKQAE
jgi:hypothetical protein